MARHKNGGNCEKCFEILNFNGGTDNILASWFLLMSSKVDDLHVSCSGRGEDEQNKLYYEKKSNAKWTESPHNYSPSLAIDLFFIDHNGNAVFDKARFKDLCLDKPANIKWGGDFKNFPDSPHFERTGWEKLKKEGSLIWSKKK
jgi:hypothetical protein